MENIANKTSEAYNNLYASSFVKAGRLFKEILNDEPQNFEVRRGLLLSDAHMFSIENLLQSGNNKFCSVNISKYSDGAPESQAEFFAKLEELQAFDKKGLELYENVDTLKRRTLANAENRRDQYSEVARSSYQIWLIVLAVLLLDLSIFLLIMCVKSAGIGGLLFLVPVFGSIALLATKISRIRNINYAGRMSAEADAEVHKLRETIRTQEDELSSLEKQRAPLVNAIVELDKTLLGV